MLNRKDTLQFCIDSCGRNLQGMVLQYMDFSEIDLSGANLSSAKLSRANLAGANLEGANLAGVDLSGANLFLANLSNTDLSKANLYKTNLCRANLTNSNLSRAWLIKANFAKAVLSSTCLDPDPEHKPNQQTGDLEVREVDGEVRVYGWRTKRSVSAGTSVYHPGRMYEAPWFSTADYDCHPGIYLATKEWLDKYYNTSEYVRCYCLKSEIHQAGDKFRAKRLWIV